MPKDAQYVPQEKTMTEHWKVKQWLDDTLRGLAAFGFAAEQCAAELRQAIHENLTKGDENDDAE